MVVKGDDEFSFGNAWTEMSIDIHVEIFSEKLRL